MHVGDGSPNEEGVREVCEARSVSKDVVGDARQALSCGDKRA